MTRHRIATAAALALIAGTAAAQTSSSSPYYIGLSETVSHESNLLNLGNDQPTPAGFHKSDTVYTAALLGGIDQHLGRQRVYGSLSVRDLRYAENSRYNNVAYSGNVGLDWSTIERISGSLTAGISRSLASFDYGQFGLTLQDKNLEKSENVNASVSVGLVTEYSFDAAVGALRVRNSLDIPYTQSRNFNQDNGSVGVTWRPRSATTVGLRLRGTRGDYPQYIYDNNGNYQSDRFKQRGAELTTTLQPSGSSTVDGRLGFARTTYDLNQQRDFSGVTGTLGWIWQPGGRLRLTTRLTRDTGQDAYSTVVSAPLSTASNYVRFNNFAKVSNALRLQADYELTAKIALTGAYQAVRRTIVSTVLDPNNPTAQDKATEFLNEFSVGARWTPLRAVQVGCDVRYANRNASGSPLLSYDFKDTVYSCFGQVTLQ